MRKPGHIFEFFLILVLTGLQTGCETTDASSRKKLITYNQSVKNVNGFDFSVLGENSLETSFGTVIGYQVSNHSSEFIRPGADRIIFVNGSKFLMDSETSTFYDSNMKRIIRYRLKACCGDEMKFGSLIDILRPGLRQSLDKRKIRLEIIFFNSTKKASNILELSPLKNNLS